MEAAVEERRKLNRKCDGDELTARLPIPASCALHHHTSVVDPSHGHSSQTTDNPQPSKSISALGQISGHVYRSDTGEPVPKAQVDLYPADTDTAKAAGSERIVRSATDGTFVFPDLPAGTYGVSVWRNGFSEFSPQEQEDDHGQFVTLKPGEKLDSLTLRLYPTE